MKELWVHTFSPIDTPPVDIMTSVFSKPIFNTVRRDVGLQK